MRNIITTSLPALLASLAVLHTVTVVVADDMPRERVSINDGWRFYKGDPESVRGALHYDKIKAWILPTGNAFVKDPQKRAVRPAGNPGADVSFVQPGYDDSGWRRLDLPHDWGIEGPFDQNLPGNTGKLPYFGIAWYRKHFSLSVSDAGKRIYLDVDGAMSFATVWCNGQFAGGWPYGYNSFRIDLTSFVKTGSDNVLSIRLENPNDSSRWYPGGGIYRNVWLVKTSPVHVSHWGAYVATPEVSTDSAKVSMNLSVDNNSGTEAGVSVKSDVYLCDASGKGIGKPVFSFDPAELKISAGTQKSAVLSAGVSKPMLWSVENPVLYCAQTTLSQNGAVVDKYETKFGIRSIKFTADDGFHLNGKRVQIKGVCNHHDLGALGSAFNFRAAERQLEIMKEMGANALRTSHNMPAPELLDLCDRMGILVMDESFDCWKRGKTRNDYNKLWDDWHEKDLRAEYRRDRNHPSVIMWSIGNEVPELGDKEKGPAIASHLTAIAHDEDPTRPVVLGSNNGGASYNGVQKSVDIMGQNYEMGGYTKFRTQNPNTPLVGSETASTVSTRGEYFFESNEAFEKKYAEDVSKAVKAKKPVPKKPLFIPVGESKAQGRSDFQVSSYDYSRPAWAWVPDDEFTSLLKNPHVAGEFVWTGFDYLGEPTPYNSDTTSLLNFHDKVGRAEMERQLKELGKIKVPSRSSYFGIVDLAGFKKDRFYLYQAHWRPDFPMAHILPHWNWPERVGQVTPVYVYTSGDAAELFLNGKSLGRKKKNKFEYRIRWNDVVYDPGELKVVAYKEGKQWAEDAMKTTGPAAKLMLKPDRAEIKDDGLDLSFVTVTIADKDGLPVPRSKNPVKFELSGPGEIVAVDNGDPTSFEPFQASQRKAFNGLALAIIRAKRGQPGEIVVNASSQGLTRAIVRLISE